VEVLTAGACFAGGLGGDVTIKTCRVILGATVPWPKVGGYSCLRHGFNRYEAGVGRRGPGYDGKNAHAEVPLKVTGVDDQADLRTVAFMLSLMGQTCTRLMGLGRALGDVQELQPSVSEGYQYAGVSEDGGCGADQVADEGTSTTIIAMTGLGDEQDRRRPADARLTITFVNGFAGGGIA